jgi:hypothetical protein
VGCAHHFNRWAQPTLQTQAQSDRLKLPDDIHIEEIYKVRVVFTVQIALEKPALFIDLCFARIKKLIGAAKG